MRFKKFLSLSLIPLNSLLLFFVLVEKFLATPVWLQVFGRMHPLMLHFPIVFTLILVALLFLAPFKNDSRHWLGNITEWVLLLSAFTCSLTALMGFFLAKDGGYEEDAISWHKWSGILLPFILFIIYNFKDKILINTVLTRGVALAIAVFVTIAAHYGGEITHGENFVFQPVTPEKTKIVPSLEEAFVFADLVQPIIDKKCLSCHNNKKAKGELIMETKELLLKGGENGVLWDTTKQDLGLMMKRIHLPLEDKKHMPPSGKPQLTDEEIVILQAWIRGGADFEKRVIELPPTDTLLLIAKRILKPSSEKQYDFAAADEKLITQLTNNNRVIAPIATGSPALKVNFYNSTLFDPASIRELNKLAPQIVEINLINMPVEDEDLKSLTKFTNLRKLFLNFTPITGRALSELQTLPNLQILSLTGTKIEYPHLRSLQSFPKLNTVYLWGTSITAEQINELRKQDKRIAYQTGFNGDTLVMQLTPPIIENEDQIIYTSLPLRLKHNITGTEIRYSLNGEEPDSINSPVYSKEVALQSPGTVKTRAFKKGWISSETRERYFYKSTYKPDTIVLNAKPEDNYRSSGSKTLYDGEKSDLTVQSKKWLGYNKNKFDVTVELDSVAPVSNVTLSVLRDQGAYIFLPAKVEIWAGAHKNKLQLLKTGSYKLPKEQEKNANIPLEFDFKPFSAKYIRIVAHPIPALPSWHPARGEKGYFFIDEIFVN